MIDSTTADNVIPLHQAIVSYHLVIKYLACTLMANKSDLVLCV
jgi:hypothetical protein